MFAGIFLFSPFILSGFSEKDKESLSRADQLFAATLYEEAIPVYLSIQDKSLREKARLHLAQAYFYLGLYDEALKEVKELSDEAFEEKTFLMALCYRHFGNMHAVIRLLADNQRTTYADEAAFELATAYWLLGEKEEAEKTFHRLDKSNDLSLKTLSQIGLVRLAIEDGRLDEAENSLKNVPEGETPLISGEILCLKGLLAYEKKSYEQAAAFYESALSFPVQEEALRGLNNCAQKLGELADSKEEKERFFLKAQEYAEKLWTVCPSENNRIALANVYLDQCPFFGTHFFKSKSSQLIDQEVFKTEEGRAAANFLSIAMMDEYAQRSAAYKEMLQEKNFSEPIYARTWYLSGLNDYEEGVRNASPSLLVQSVTSFEKAKKLSGDKQQALACLNGVVRSLWAQGKLKEKIDAVNILQQEVEANTALSLEAEWLHAKYVLFLAEEYPAAEALKSIKAWLEKRSLQGSERSMLTLAKLYSKQGFHESATQAYLVFATNHPNHPNAPFAMLEASLSAENAGDKKNAQEIRWNLYKTYPSSDEAAQAYFHIYTYEEYLQGCREAIKHLNTFKEKFPNSPLQLTTHFLIGLDLKRDRRSPEGKWIRKKNLTQSVQAFGDVQTLFQQLENRGAISKDDREHYLLLSRRAALEKAIVYSEIAKESSTAKKDIYLKYAVDELTRLSQNVDAERDLALHEESLFALSHVYLQQDNEEAAQHIQKKMFEIYQKRDVTAGYYLAKFYEEQGALAYKHQDYNEALTAFLRAEDASKGKYLSVDEQIELWIQQSRCCESLGQLERAMLTLSKAVNQHSISHLRIKAMWMRAHLYEQMGRSELAKRQLESVAKMGGEWGEQAKIKLEQMYVVP